MERLTLGNGVVHGVLDEVPATGTRRHVGAPESHRRARRVGGRQHGVGMGRGVVVRSGTHFGEIVGECNATEGGRGERS